MTDDRDFALQSLFDKARLDLDGEVFVAGVITRTRNLRYQFIAGLIGSALALAACAWYLAIPIEIAQLITRTLSTTLIDLGTGWLAWLFSPVNNIASLFVVGWKAIRIARKKILGAY